MGAFFTKCGIYFNKYLNSEYHNSAKWGTLIGIYVGFFISLLPVNINENNFIGRICAYSLCGYFYPITVIYQAVKYMLN